MVRKVASRAQVEAKVLTFSSHKLWQRDRLVSAVREALRGSFCPSATLIHPSCPAHPPTRGARSMARATARRCSWPPLSWLPPSPRRVAKPSGKASMNSRACAALAAACTCCMDAPLPRVMLSRMLALQGGKRARDS